MPRQPATRCCELVRRRLQLRSEGIWITDGVLASAFERFCQVSKFHRRLASNVPGPLESRRRLGKRRMTDLGVQVHPSLPDWALPYIPDLTEWEWQPPNRSFRQTRDGTSSFDRSQSPLVGVFSRLFGLAEADTRLPEEESILEGKEEPYAAEGWSFEHFLMELSALRTSFNSAPLDHVRRGFDEVCNQLKQQLALATISPEEAIMAFDTIREELVVQFPLSDHISRENLSIRLHTAIIDGIIACKVLKPQDFGAALWSKVIRGLSDLTSSLEFCDLFARVMIALPSNFVPSISKAMVDIILKICQQQNSVLPHADVSSAIDEASYFSEALGTDLTTAKNALEAGQGLRASLLIGKARVRYRQARDCVLSAESTLSIANIKVIALPMRFLSLQRHKKILDNVTKIMLNQAFRNKATGQHMIYRWVHLLAHLPQVGQKYLRKILSRSSHAGLEIPSNDLCEIIISDWEGQGHLSKPLLSHFRSMCLKEGDQSLAALARAVFETQPDTSMTLFVGIWKFLKALRYKSRLVDAIWEDLGTPDPPPIQLLEVLARSSRDFRVSLDLKSMYDEKTRTAQCVQPMWRLDLWERDAYVMAAAAGVSVAPDDIYYALDIHRYRSQSASNVWGRYFHGQKFRYQKVGERTVFLVTKLAVHFAHAADLSNREAFNRVWLCWRFIRTHDYSPSRTLSGALYHAITRDLHEGHGGHIKRRRWFLQYVRTHYGDEVAFDCGQTLLQWMQENRQQANEERRLEKAMQKTR